MDRGRAFQIASAAQTSMKSADLLVLLALEELCRDDEIHISVPEIAEVTLQSVPTTRRALQRLADAGVIEIRATFYEDGARGVNTYRVTY